MERFQHFLLHRYPLYTSSIHLTPSTCRPNITTHRVQAGPHPFTYLSPRSSENCQISHETRQTTTAMTETIQSLPLPQLRSRSSKATRSTQANPKYSPSADSTTSISSLPSTGTETESVEEQEKKYDDPYPDFLWMTTEEPHRSRRMAILKAHPEVCRFWCSGS